MFQRVSSILCLSPLALLLAASPLACGEPDPTAPATDEAIQQVYEGKLTLSQASATCHCQLEVVRIGGTVFHFGLDLTQTPPVSFPFQSTVAGTRVWIAEVPATRRLNIHSDANGRWGFAAVKIKGTPLPVSFVYEATGYTTTKSQVFSVEDTALTDLSVQFPTEAYFTLARAQVEQQVGALIGAPYSLHNVLVTTVGKAWASMYSPDLPHGDPGAQVTISPAIQFPASLGPVYFNEAVAPDPSLASTSVDGGVLFGNLANGPHALTASKAPFSYSTLTFVIEDGIGLYIASPPHGIQGTNSSPPGQP